MAIQDSKGELNNGDTTVDTRVTLTGKASIEQEVEIFDNLTVSQGRKKTDSNGNWDLVISGLSVTGHSLTAKALYGSGQASAARTFTVTALTVPTITLVRDSRGELNDGDTTVDTRVTLTGKASIEQEVEIFDNLTVSHGRKKTDSSGNWTLDISGLGVTGHSLTAKALYGSGQTSTARTFTVTALAVPSITSVRDSKDELDNGDTTVDTRVTLTGKASIKQEVEVFDNLTVSHGRKKTDNNGNWDLVISGLSETDHSLTAKALYGSGATSTARTFTVTALDRPTIASVRDSKGEVRNGGTTLDTRVTLAGKASVRQEVEIFDNLTVSHGRKRADDNGDWDMVVSGLSMTTLAKRDVPEHYAFVQANAGKGYRPALHEDWSSNTSTRKIGWLWNEWGNLHAYYPYWPEDTGQDQPIWLVNDPGGTVGWRGGSYLGRPGHWSINNAGQGRRWTICYVLKT